MIEKIYAKYFQKSKSFLYPALGIRRASNIAPEGTYIAIKDYIDPDDMKLICHFKSDESEGFKAFEQKMLIENPLYVKTITIGNDRYYIFDMSIYKNDWFNFIMGKYSKLNTVMKKAIKHYYGESSSSYEHMEAYLYPDKHYEVYSKLLDIDVDKLKQIGELCDPCDLEKETLIIPLENLDL